MSINLDRLKDDSATKIDSLSFDEFIDFIFNRNQEKERSFDEYKFGDTEIAADYLTILFHNPEFLPENYSLEQLEEGFEFIAELLCFIKFSGLLWDKRLALSVRQELISAMFDLFSKFFANNPMESIDFMWWDILGYGYYMENGQAEDEDGAEIHKTMFETLKNILEIDSESCQKSALHGLGHLKHPETEKTINSFLRRYIVGEELREYALLCIKSEMQ